MKRNALFIAFLALTISGWTQISGLIVDQSTKAGISNVNVIKKNTNLGVSTNQDGRFQFSYFQTGDTIIVSHVSYEKKEFVITKSRVLIELNALTNALTDVAIYSEKNELKLSDSPWIIDYDIINDSSIFIAKIGPLGSRLDLLVNNKTRTIQFSGIDRIEKNCLGETYVIKNDTAYHFQIKDGELFVASYLELPEFETIQRFCTKRINGIQYFNYSKHLNKAKFFTILEDTVPETFHTVFDQTGYRYASSYHNESRWVRRFLESQDFHRMGINCPDSNEAYPQKVFRDLEDVEDYSTTMIKMKTISKLMEYDNQLIILDNVNKELVYFNREHKIEKIVPLALDFKPEKIKQIIQDPISQEVYYLVKAGSQLNIYRLNFENIQLEYVMSRSANIEEVKVYQGLLYYIKYNTRNETKELYKLSI